jgi:hypothetical protein
MNKPSPVYSGAGRMGRSPINRGKFVFPYYGDTFDDDAYVAYALIILLEEEKVTPQECSLAYCNNTTRELVEKHCNISSTFAYACSMCESGHYFYYVTVDYK